MHSRKDRTRKQIGHSIIAWLFALAILCERAAVASAPMRLAALWFLRQGERFIYEYVQGLADDFGYCLRLPVLGEAWQDDSPEEALRLAYQFRALAEVLQFLYGWLYANDADLPLGRPVRLAAFQRTQALRTKLSSRLQALASLSPGVTPAPDTS